MIVIIGKTASGKDTIVKQLTEKHGFKRIVTTTTRPMRAGEKEGISYNFISEADFLQKIENGYFAEWKSYDTEFGKWYYGTSVTNICSADNKSIVILTPAGFRDVKKIVKNGLTSIYIYANNETIKNRLIKRGDDKNEAQRRLEHDNEDFKNVQDEVDLIVYNNEHDKITNVVHKIFEYVNKEVKHEDD